MLRGKHSTRSRTAGVGSIVAVTAAAVGLTASAHADSLIATDPTATNLSASAGTLAWSRREPSGHHRLVIRRAGVIADAPVAPFSVPVDADLGQSKDGRLVAVYARCPSQRSCDLFELDVDAGTEHKLGALSSGSRSEAAASVFGGRIAFTRTRQFSTNSLIRHSRDGGLFVGRRRIDRRAVVEIDLSRTWIAFKPYDFESDAILVRRLSRRGRPRACRLGGGSPLTGSSSGIGLSGPLLAEGFLWWMQESLPAISDESPRAAGIARRRLPRGGCRYGRIQYSRTITTSPSPYTRPTMDSFALDGTQLYYTAGGVWAVDRSSLGLPD
ncbi:MAG: hypothetical protein M3131_01205 [Actinomycetota bacterium]|nr:hypothetical protein [Actinomycetota bacterium]